MRSASFEVHNSPLSEFACLGFEYGYSVAAPDALVLWEAQFGDFVNGAQIIIDQFLVAGLSKWGQTSRLTLLLPHGYEGNGPEHSSARLERFLQLAAQENIRVANCTTAAQYFHLLRRQALDATARPLIVMTPKGLLRLKQAASVLADCSEGKFEPVLDDPGAEHELVRRLVLCSGKLYYDIDGHEDRVAARLGRGRAARAALPVPGGAGRRAHQRRTRTCKRSSGPRRSRRTWAPGGSIRHRLEEPRPTASPLRYVGPPLACEPERGLSDGSPGRAGPNRPQRRWGPRSEACGGQESRRRAWVRVSVPPSASACAVLPAAAARGGTR